MPSDDWTLDISLAPIVERAPEAATQAVMDGAEHILGKARPLAPKQDGNLRASGKVRPNGPGVASIKFDDPIATIQHERLDYKHDDGQAKYLEQPFNAEIGAVAEIVRRQLAAALGLS